MHSKSELGFVNFPSNNIGFNLLISIMQIGLSQKTSASPKTLSLLIFEPRQAVESALKSATECSLRAECALFACKTKRIHGRVFLFFSPSVYFSAFSSVCRFFYDSVRFALYVFVCSCRTRWRLSFRRFANAGSKLKKINNNWLCLNVGSFDGADSRSVVLVRWSWKGTCWGCFNCWYRKRWKFFI